MLLAFVPFPNRLGGLCKVVPKATQNRTPPPGWVRFILSYIIIMGEFVIRPVKNQNKTTGARERAKKRRGTQKPQTSWCGHTPVANLCGCKKGALLLGKTSQIFPLLFSKERGEIGAIRHRFLCGGWSAMVESFSVLLTRAMWFRLWWWSGVKLELLIVLKCFEFS